MTTILNSEKTTSAALAAFGIYSKCHDDPRLFSPVDYDEAFTLLGMTKTVAQRINLGQYIVTIDDGTPKITPVDVMRGVYVRILSKRNMTFAEYKDAVIIRNRACTNPRKYGGVDQPRKSAAKSLIATLEVINRLTRGKDKARALFDAELRKVGVFLPPDTLGEPS